MLLHCQIVQWSKRHNDLDTNDIKSRRYEFEKRVQCTQADSVIESLRKSLSLWFIGLMIHRAFDTW